MSILDNRRRMMLATLGGGPLWLFTEGQGFVDGKAIAYTYGNYDDPSDPGGYRDDNLYVHFNNSYIWATREYGGIPGPRAIIGLLDGNPINFGKYKTLYFEYENKGYDTSSSYTRAAYGYTPFTNINSVYCDGTTTYGFSSSFFDAGTSRRIRSIDISSVNGNFYVAFAQSSASNKKGVYIYNIWLE